MKDAHNGFLAKKHGRDYTQTDVPFAFFCATEINNLKICATSFS
ncbi:conserved hypothetical protein [Escherichia coli H299]|nr:conserved hypothetical protein [Escherichia coli H299]ESD08228.1 hypothetical protein HMPREF1590_00734 [Escherichia coli 113302]KDW45458.1 hypothetical protein AC97_1587 [Escherichia coli 2-177-06_S4_C2]KDX52775.1 hypothetical protein AC69_0786 [Escherichia coli 2-177-06_S4_C1]